MRLLSWIRPYTIHVLCSIVLAVLYSAANLYFLPLTEDIISALNKKELSFLHNQIFNAIGLITLRFGTQFGQFYLVSWISHRLIIDLRLSLYQKLQLLSNAFYEEWKLGELLNRSFNDVAKIQDGILILFRDFFPQTITFISVLTYLFVISWKLTCFSLITIPLFVAIIGRQKSVLKKSMAIAQRQLASVTHITQETLQNIKLVQAYTMESYEYRRLHKESFRNFVSMMRGIKIRSFVEFSISILQFTVLILVVWIGGIEVTKGTLESPQLASFFIGLLMLIDPIILLSKLFNKIQLATVSADRFFEIYDQKPSILVPDKPTKPTNILGNIRFDKVSFSYDTEEQFTLKDLSLDIPANKVVALVGPSGSGKSSLMNLIPRFSDPTKGTISLDGIDLKNMDPHELRKHIAWVPQQDILFRGTILENIRYGSPQAKEEQIIDAAKRANAWSFTQELPEGLFTQLSDMGRGLSGGQRQRISIARALLRDPQILLLDEATSALDTKSEKLVQDALNELMKNRTTIIIAHRLTTIQHADIIVVMDRGQIAEMGSHQELLLADGHYAELYRLQFLQEPSHD